MNLHFYRWKPKPSEQMSENSSFPLVFLHGMGGTGAIWRPVAAQLEDHFDCIAPDQRGHGKSRPVPLSGKGEFEAQDYARDVIELLDSLGVEKFWLIGHSMGVRTALALASAVPTRVAGLIAVDIGISQNWGGGVGLPLAEFIEKLPRTFPTRNSLKEYVFAHCPDPAIAAYLHAVAKKDEDAVEETWVFPFEHENLVETIHKANLAPIGEWVTQICDAGVKVTFLRGERSKVWLKEDYEEQRVKYAHPNLEFQEWENCGHGLPFEQRAKFVELIKQKVSHSNRTNHPLLG